MARPDNLFEPVEKDRGATGRFTSVARSGAVSAPAAIVRGGTVAIALAVIAGLAALARKSSR